MMFVLLASIFVLIFIFGLIGFIYPTKLHKQMKLGNRLRNVALLFVAFIAFFVVVINSPDESQPVAQETKLHQEEQNKAVNWQEEIKQVAESNKSETEKYDVVMKLAKEYQPSKEELAEFKLFIVGEFRSGKYLSDPKNHEYMLSNIFKAAVINEQYKDKDQEPINEFAFDFLQNTKYVYRGVDDVDSQAVKANERQMEKALEKMEQAT
jgi:hypothetical protein